MVTSELKTPRVRIWFALVPVIHESVVRMDDLIVSRKRAVQY